MPVATGQRTAVYARTTTSFTIEHGLPVSIVQGEPWASDDPAVRAHPQLFSPAPLVKTIRGWVALDD